ncbi:hypothetical protein Pmani_022449 [Petrolisthes manimaculis]|uniref:Uncharacterized protein n=1 Tax=Petrolisthes manimaculis TaxID=1843537 RepID=A0AAE1PDW7_9EUCA|nr:hypothetical protein Pmani_022449 [Petrolisthes manimaculis]
MSELVESGRMEEEEEEKDEEEEDEVYKVLKVVVREGGLVESSVRISIYSMPTAAPGILPVPQKSVFS